MREFAWGSNGALGVRCLAGMGICIPKAGLSARFLGFCLNLSFFAWNFNNDGDRRVICRGCVVTYQIIESVIVGVSFDKD